jgi:hypothetical protein
MYGFEANVVIFLVTAHLPTDEFCEWDELDEWYSVIFRADSKSSMLKFFRVLPGRFQVMRAKVSEAKVSQQA